MTHKDEKYIHVCQKEKRERKEHAFKCQLLAFAHFLFSRFQSRCIMKCFALFYPMSHTHTCTSRAQRKYTGKRSLLKEEVLFSAKDADKVLIEKEKRMATKLGINFAQEHLEFVSL